MNKLVYMLFESINDLFEHLLATIMAFISCQMK